MILLRMTQNERQELDALIGQHPNKVVVESASRFHARCKILVEDGAIYWEFADKDDQFMMIKTRLDENALVFQSREVYRLAFLSAKDRIIAIRKAHQERNERRAAAPNSLASKKLRETILRAQQGLLPLEMHSHRPPTRWSRD